MVETLSTLSRRDLRLFIVSNNPWAGTIRERLKRFGLENYFESIIVSSDIGYRKPSRKIFEELIRQSSLDPSDILFVGDSYPHDIEVPKSLGMHTCLVDFEGTNKNGQLEDSKKADHFIEKFSALETSFTTNKASS